MRAKSDRNYRVGEPDQVRSAAARRSEAAASGYFESEATARMGTESGLGEWLETFAGIFSWGSGGCGEDGRGDKERVARLTGLFIQGRTGGQDREQAQDFFALHGIAELEAHTHPETRMCCQHLTSDSQFRVGRADENFDA